MLGLIVAGAVGVAGFQQAVIDCVSSHAVELAAKAPTEPAASIAQAANAQCLGTWQQAQTVEPWSINRPPTPTGSPEFRDMVLGEATRAVIESRAH